MNTPETPVGSIFSCSTEGLIIDVIKNDLVIGNTDLTNQPFEIIFEESDKEKGIAFLETARSKNSAFSWSMNTIAQQRLMSVSFIAIALDDRIIVGCATTRSMATALLQNFLRDHPSALSSTDIQSRLLSGMAKGTIQSDSEMFELLTKLNNELIVIQRSMAKQNIELDLLNKEKNSLIQDLQAALSQIKLLSGLLPICSNCKKIRDDNGRWNILEQYITSHTDATFTHGICPDCAKIFYKDFA